MENSNILATAIIEAGYQDTLAKIANDEVDSIVPVIEKKETAKTE